ncbi:hypothetical protein ACFQU7_09180 [Pseudoroseomonas wenyumeiae]
MNAPLLLHVYPTFNVGGAQVRFAAIANRFGARWRHAVVSLDGGDTCLERIAPEVPLEMLPSPPARVNHCRAPWSISAGCCTG